MSEQNDGATRLQDVIGPNGAAAAGDRVVQRAIEAVRTHLGLQVAYVSEFVDNDTVFRHVDAPGLEHLIKPGDSRSLDDVYCRHILAGRMPELIADTAEVPMAMALPITHEVPIGTHVSVPLRMSDGEIYGMFCCLGPFADKSLNNRDLGMMRAFADITAFEIDRERKAQRLRREKEARIQAVVDGAELGIVYQPIWSLAENRPIGFESLSRFTAQPIRPPDQWFGEAAEIGRGVELELLAIRHALANLSAFPRDVYVSVNAASETVLSPLLAEMLDGQPLDRIVLEITEHDCIDDFEALEGAIAPLRARGLRVAVDDAGAGHSGLQQILKMRPDLIKLDRSLIEGIGDDPGRRALAAALTMFARETGSRLIAEGVETEAELAMLRALGMEKVQGYLLGRPVPLDAARALVTEPAAHRKVA
ncbi:MAG TPA: EAL domain-containing protein [Allosphingosinicella sp.]|nr:EAL domain-containing protein [Allosphingosinicella sp.]